MGFLSKIGKRMALRKLYRAATATNPAAQVLLGAAGMAVTAGAVYVASKRRKAVQNKVVVIAGGSRGLGLALELGGQQQATRDQREESHGWELLKGFR